MPSNTSLKPALGEADDNIDLWQYIDAIGTRIRSIRTSRGVTRKELAHQSGISERYIAQIEAGKANISVAMLWKISHSMGVPIPDLFPDGNLDGHHAALQAFLNRLGPEQQDSALGILKHHFSKPRQRVRGVALIGLRGAGKTSLGKILSETYGVQFTLLSELIENQTQMSIGELFSLGGQKAYRRAEKNALQGIVQNGEKIVLETGGSLVTQRETFEILLGAYYVVWIKARPQEHMNRVIAQGDMRPMADIDDAMEDLKLILDEREARYRQADYILDTADRSEAECAQELVERCQAYLAPGSSAAPDPSGNAER